MTKQYERYAIYFAPDPDSELGQFGKEWLGIDTHSNWITDPPTPFVESPRRYGFHATLKAPMHLRQNISYPEFRNAVSQLASSLKPVPLGQLKLTRVGHFLALTTCSELHESVAELAWSCVTELDQYRAPLTDHDRNRRPNLNSRDRANLEKWGYPYVGEAFRFHITLSSALKQDLLDQAEEKLAGQIPNEETTIHAISIFGDPGNSKPFEFVDRFALKG